MPMPPASASRRNHRNASNQRQSQLILAACETLERRTLLSGALFSAAVNYPVGGTGATSGVAIDVNGDGNLDIVTADYNGKISVLLGNGDGTFQPAYRVGDGLPNGQAKIISVYSQNSSNSNSNSSSNSNGSGHKTSFLVFSGNEASLIQSNGDGTFQPANVIINAPSFITSAAIGDFNGDGQPDLAVAYADDNISILLSQPSGYGPLTLASTLSTGDFPVNGSMYAADFNNDGHTDLALSTVGGGIEVFLGNGDGTFASPTTVLQTSDSNIGFRLGDINDDGNTDILAGGSTGSLTVLLGNGDGTFHELTGPNVPAGVKGGVSADFNGDGKPDVALVSASSSTVTVLPGNGDGTFGAALSYNVGSGPYDVIAADFNGDGTPDIATINVVSDSVSVLLHTVAATGSGFQAPVTFPTASKPKSIALADLTGNGIDDLVVAENHLNELQIFPGNGDGTFGAPTVLSGFNNAYSVKVADVNGDGHPDLIVGCSSNYNGVNNSFLAIALGNGNGTFKAPVIYNLPGNSNYSGNVSIAVGDLNGDHRPDIAVISNGGVNQLDVLLNNGDGTFQAPLTYSTFTYPSAVAIGDLNGDGFPEIVVANSQSGTLSIFVNTLNEETQQREFIDESNPRVGQAVRSIAIADLNGDGNADIVVSSPGNYYLPGATATVGVLLGNGDLGFAPLQDIALPGNRAGSALVGDVNGDGKPDIVVVTGYETAGTDRVDVLAGNGDGTFKAPTSYSIASAPSSVVLGDVNRDGRLDIVTSNDRHYAISVLINTSSGGVFGAARTVTLNGNLPESIATGDLNGDGNADVVVANETDGTIEILYGNGDGTFKAPVTYTAVPSPTCVVLADLTNDLHLDIVVASSTEAEAVVFLGNGNGTFQPPIDVTLPQIPVAGPDSIAIADINGDGNADLVEASNDGGAIYILLGQGNGQFQLGSTINSPATLFAVAATDVNGDGHADIIYTYSDAVGVLLNNGSGGFAPPELYSVGNFPTSIAVGKLTGSLHADIVVTNEHYNTVSVLLGNGNGHFQLARNFAAGNNPFQAVISDVNGDGNPDLLVVDAGSSDYPGNQLATLLGNGSGGFAAPVFSAVGNYPRSLVAVDLNGDGNPDVVVADGIDNTLSVLLNNGKAKVTMSGNTVSITGSTSSNDVNITASNGEVTLNINGSTMTYSASAVGVIDIKLGAGDDSINLMPGIPAVSVFGGAGNDTIMAMNAGDTVNGGGGNDMVVGGNVPGGQLNGGAGNDTVMGGGNDAMLMGGAGTDLLEGSHKTETLNGGGGNDTVSSSTGHDSIRGGPGDNIILDGGSKKDTVDGGPGLSFAQYNPTDVVTNIFQFIDPQPPSSPALAASSPAISPAAGLVVTAVDTDGVIDIEGTAGADSIDISTDETNLIVKNNGNLVDSFPLDGLTGILANGKGGGDTITVDPAVTLMATLFGGAGPDSIIAGGGSSVLDGGNGSDTLVGGAGTSLLVAGQFESFTNGLNGKDLLIGGTGFSIADFSYRTDSMFLSNDGTNDSGDSILGEKITIMPSVQGIWGGSGNDTIIGTSAGEFLSGGGGNDSISSGGASDLVVGGTGDDSVKVNAEPVTLYLRDGQADQYSGITDPSIDVLQLDAGLDVLVTG
jgi:hypothetical protein